MSKLLSRTYAISEIQYRPCHIERHLHVSCFIWVLVMDSGMQLIIIVMSFQVFNTYSNEDYDRRNDEVDPVAASAEYELEKRVEKLELFPVELEKGMQLRCSVEMLLVFSSAVFQHGN